MRIGDRNYDIDDNLEIVKPVNSEITILDLKPFIDSLCPIQIFIDEQMVYDDTDFDSEVPLFKKYDDITTQKVLVATISVEIVNYHHSIIKITTA